MTERSTFALWLEAITCEDPDWLMRARAVNFLCADQMQIADLWLSWPGHENHTLWCIP